MPSLTKRVPVAILLARAAILSACCSIAPACAAEPTAPAPSETRVALTEETSLEFASIEQGRKVLLERDEYVERLSPFDRQSRLAAAEPVAEAQYLEFVGQQVQAWSPEEIAHITMAAESLAKRIAGLKLRLPLPKSILLIKTSGREEAGAAYTRGTAIILPRNRLNEAPVAQEKLLAHELFHVLSRYDADARGRLYGVIGFRPAPGVKLPPQLQPLRITNPDGPRYDFSIRVEHDQQPVEAVPVLYAKSPYDPARQKSFFGYLQFRLMVIDRQGEAWAPRMAAGEPVMLAPGELPDFGRQIGANTGYIIHPDEILADNFVHLLMETPELKSPQVVAGIRQALAN